MMLNTRKSMTHTIEVIYTVDIQQSDQSTQLQSQRTEESIAHNAQTALQKEHDTHAQSALRMKQKRNDQTNDVKYSTINDIPMQLKSRLIFNSLTSQQPNYSHKERRSQQPQTHRLGRERCTTLTWNSFKDEEEKLKVSDKSGTESDGIDLTDRSFNITPTSTTQFHNNITIVNYCTTI